MIKVTKKEYIQQVVSKKKVTEKDSRKREDIEGHQTCFLCQTQAQAMQNMSPTCCLGDLCSTSWSFEPNLMRLKASFQVVLF